MKQKHRHILEATIICAEPFDPEDLEALAVISAQFRGMAKALHGYRSVSVRMTKEPMPNGPDSPGAASTGTATPEAVTQGQAAPAQFDPEKDRPAFLKRTEQG